MDRRGVIRGTTLALVCVATLLTTSTGRAQDFALAERFRLVGTQTCTAANCHNLPPGEDRKELDYGAGSEYAIWLHHDRHARAYTVLFNRQSRAIAARLGLPSAATAKVCLACHSTLSTAELQQWPDNIQGQPEIPPERRAQLREGVGCESCHGAAEGWLAPHKTPNWQQVYDWKTLGFIDNKNLAARADQCMACHVGGPGRDVDHDLIAAGHPRLTFDLAAYHRIYQRHWPEAKDGSPAELWAVGQKSAGLAALTQLIQRATSSAETGKKPTPWVVAAHKELELPGPAQTPWPEFAELSCFACHHDLQQPSWRQTRPEGSLGFAEWGSWTFALWPALARAQGQAAFAGDLETLGRVVNDPTVPRDKVAELATLLRENLRDLPVSPATLPPGWLTLPGSQGVRVAEWDHAAQVVLALEALEPGLAGSLGQTRRALWFPGPKPVKFNSPQDFGQPGGPVTLEKFEELRAGWHRQLQSPPAP